MAQEKLRQLMIDWELWKPKPCKQAKDKHFWRPRKDNFGEMEQFDGSYHVWFGDEESCLLLSVDDATGKITHAKFAVIPNRRANLHKPLNKATRQQERDCLKYSLFKSQEQRKIMNDYTIRFKNQYFHLDQEQPINKFR
jgi:hypothetical protein